jgi:excinuclease ABC subunit A
MSAWEDLKFQISNFKFPISPPSPSTPRPPTSPNSSFTENRQQLIARDILPEIRQRLEFLQEVGLGYLQLDRSGNTLSGGESQRIRLAAQLGSNLRGVLYVLDEPTIGLHPRDNAALLKTLIKLRDHGNSLIIVEHDEDTIAAADHLIDLGPAAGGSVVKSSIRAFRPE